MLFSLGEVEIDPERLREYHRRYPEVNRNLVDNLKLWSKIKDSSPNGQAHAVGSTRTKGPEEGN